MKINETQTSFHFMVLHDSRNLHDIILCLFYFWQSFESRSCFTDYNQHEKFRFNEVSFTDSFYRCGMQVKNFFPLVLRVSRKKFFLLHILGLLFSIAKHCAPFSFVIMLKLKLLMKSIEPRQKFSELSDAFESQRCFISRFWFS